MISSLCSDHNKKYQFYSLNSNTLKCNKCKESYNGSDLIPLNTIILNKISDIEKLEKKLNKIKHNTLLRENINLKEEELKESLESFLCSSQILNNIQEEIKGFLKLCSIQLARDIIAAKSFTSKDIIKTFSEDIMVIKQELKDYWNNKDYSTFLNATSNLSLFIYNCEETMKHFKFIERILIDREIS